MKNFFLTLAILSSLLSLTPHVTHAATDLTYTLLAPIPLEGANGGETHQVRNLSTYVPGAIKLIIGLAGVLAVLMIMIGGMKYVGSASVGGKSSGRETIKNALIGLLLVISSWVILNTLNPKLLDFDLKSLTPENAGGIPIDTGLPDAPPTGPGGAGCDSTTPVSCDYTTPAQNGGWGSCESLGCVKLAGIDTKGCPGPNGCEVVQGLFLRLVTLNFSEGAGKWRVTEAWPPSYKGHVDTCHQPGPAAGSCVDAALVSSSGQPPVSEIKTFLQNIKNSGSNSFQYEVGCPPAAQDQSTCNARVKAIQDAVGSSFKVVGNANATGEHAHINYP